MRGLDEDGPEEEVTGMRGVSRAFPFSFFDADRCCSEYLGCAPLSLMAEVLLTVTFAFLGTEEEDFFWI